MTARERAAIERAIAGMPAEAAAVARLRYEVATCLFSADTPWFASADEAADEKVPALRRLGSAVRLGLRVCGPEYGRCNIEAWQAKLLEGARECWAIAYPMGQCEDWAFGWKHAHHQERPDRWFGVPLIDLTDGQWMGYRAAVAYYYERQRAQAQR